MKTKAKLVLALSVLTAGTAVAGATGTFAWFTTNRSATLTYSKVVAQSSNAKLEVKLGGITDSGLTEQTNYNAEDGSFADAISLTSAKSFTTDVSSVDGKKFYKPDWKGVAGNNAEVYSVKEAKDGFTQFYFTVKNTGNSATHVFFNEGTAVMANAAGNAADAALAQWTRVAVLETTATATPKATDVAASTLKVMFENEASGANKGKGIASTDMTTDNKATITDVADATHKVGAFEAVVSGVTKTTNNKAYLGELAANATKAYIVSVWLEGTEADNQDAAAAGGAVDVTLKLTGIETVGTGA